MQMLGQAVDDDGGRLAGVHYEVIEKVGGNESRLSELGWLLGAYGYCGGSRPAPRP